MGTELSDAGRSAVGRTGDVALAALNALPQTSVLVFDATLTYVLVAGGALARHGVSAVTLEGRRCEDVLAGDRWGTYEPMYRAALRGESSSTEVDAIDSNGRYRIDVGPLRDAHGDIVGGLVTARDVTAQRAAEARRDEGHRLLPDILDSLPAGVSVKDDQRRFVLVNRAYEDAQQLGREDIIGRTVKSLYPEEQSDSCDAADERVLTTGEADTEERTVAGPGGSMRTYLISRSPLRDSHGGIYGLCAAAADITGRIEMEQV